VMIKSKDSGIVNNIKETHKMRYLFKPEIDKLLSLSGFHLITYEEWKTGKVPDCTSWNVCFVAQRVSDR